MLVTSPRRLVLSAAALLLSGVVLAQGSDSFNEAVAAYQRGEMAAAAEGLKAALAENPSNEEAFRMWQAAEQQVVREMLLERGELGTLAERFLGLATLGRREIAADPGGAEEVVARMLAGDEVERQQAMLELRANYGSWAVPALVGPLGDLSSMENRVHAIQALVKLGSRATMPLVAVLGAEDALTRRNAAAVLGTLRDPRAAPGLAWMAATDPDADARSAAGQALGKLALVSSDPADLSRAVAERFFRGDEEYVRPYDSAAVIWSWQDGSLQGRAVLGGLYALEVAESISRHALEKGAGATIRPLLAAVHAAQKAEILAAAELPGLAETDLVEAAQQRLPALDVDLALAGSHRGRGLILCLAGAERQVAAAEVLMESMGSSTEERQALNVALQESDPVLAIGAAIALGRQGVTDPGVIERLAGALAAAPTRTVLSVGQTGLAGGAPGWQLLSAGGVAEGLLRAKTLPPKDVIVIQDGLQGVTLDTMVFALKGDPRTAEVPLIITTRDVEEVSALYGDQAAAVLGSASFNDVREVAQEATGSQAAAIARARHAGEVLAGMPPAVLRGLGSRMAVALTGVADDSVRTAILHLVARASAVEALPAVEALVLDDGLGAELRGAALMAAADLWAVSPPRGDVNALSDALLPLVAGGDEALRLAAARALGQLAGASDATVSSAVQ
jgi:hypothetical protein